MKRIYQNRSESGQKNPAPKVSQAGVEPEVRGLIKGGSYASLDDGLNFSNKVLEHMGKNGRQVPMQTLQEEQWEICLQYQNKKV